jgi:hypothetical protein
MKTFAFISLAIFLSVYAYAEENITITTYYPSPYGSYRNLNIYNQDEDTNQVDFTRGITKAGLLITTDYTNNAYTPGVFWSTTNNNPLKPKAGIYLKETTNATSMYLGTSNKFTTGITNNAMVIDENGNVDITGGIRPGNQNTVTACSGTSAGTMRYNTDSDQMEFCNGSGWNVLGGGGVEIHQLQLTSNFTGVQCFEANRSGSAYLIVGAMIPSPFSGYVAPVSIKEVTEGGLRNVPVASPNSGNYSTIAEGSFKVAKGKKYCISLEAIDASGHSGPYNTIGTVIITD